MKTLLAKPVVAELKESTQNRVKRFIDKTKRAPKLAVVLVGEDPASVIYTRKKGEMAVKLGMEHESFRFPASASADELRECINNLNTNNRIDGILIQRPLPYQEEEVVYWVNPEKDVDAFHPENTGRLVLGLPTFAPCTPAGVMRLLAHYEIQTEGKLACVIGRSSIVGKPMATLLMQKNATILQCHSRTQDLPSLTQQADILVVAAGKPEMINGSYIKKGATVIDVGIHRKDDGPKSGMLCGDVDFASASEVAGAITPVPGGVGPMTIQVLMENTILAAEKREGLD